MVAYFESIVLCNHACFFFLVFFLRPESLGTKPHQVPNLVVCCALGLHVQFCRFDWG